MNPDKVLEMLSELRVLPFFPNDESVMNALVRLCGSMCSDETQVRWLITRMTSGIYAEWPGIAEMRGCFCCRFKPADGINAYSTVYPDGLPPDPTAPPRIAAPDFKALLPGEPVTTDPELEESIRQLAAKLRKPHRFARPLREIETPPPDRDRFTGTGSVNPNFKAVTPDDVAHAVAALRERRAREPEESEDEEKPNVVEFTRERRKL